MLRYCFWLGRFSNFNKVTASIIIIPVSYNNMSLAGLIAQTRKAIRKSIIRASAFIGIYILCNLPRKFSYDLNHKLITS